jgi:hypothetical protein
MVGALPNLMLVDEAARLIRAHVEGKFPKTCSLCGHVYSNLAEYLRSTRHVGQPISYDADLEDWLPSEPLGTYAVALCSCGTSLSIDSSGMPLLTLWRLMMFARREARRRGATVSELLAAIRVQVRGQILSEAEAVDERASAEERVRSLRQLRVPLPTDVHTETEPKTGHS